MDNTMKSRKWIARHIENLPRSGIRDFFDLVLSMDDVVTLGVGEPDFITPQVIRQSAIQSLEQGHTSYTSNLGLLSLREAICRYVARDYGVQYNPEKECIITVGVSEAFDLILRAILEIDDEVIYHQPCYVAYPSCILMARAKPVVITTNSAANFSLDPTALEAMITPKTKAIILNFPNNPTGADLSWAHKQAVADIAMKHNLVVITDEIYSELTYGQRTHSIAAIPGMKERTIFLHGFSKAYAMTGFRIGYACGPHEFIEAMMKIHQYTMLCAPILAQEAAICALEHGQKDREEMRAIYRQRRDFIVRRFNEIGLPCVMPQGAFYAYPEISSTGLSSPDFAKLLLQEERVAIVPGTAFSSDGASYIRCVYAASMEEIETALSRIEKFVARRR